MYRFSRRRLFAAGLAAAMTPAGYEADHADDMQRQLDGLLAQHEKTLPRQQVDAARALRGQAVAFARRRVSPKARGRLQQTAARAAAVEAAAGTFIWTDEQSLLATANANALAVKANDPACRAFCCGVFSVVHRYAGDPVRAVGWARVAAEQVPEDHPARATMAMHEARALVELPERNERQVRSLLDGAIAHANRLPDELIATPGVNFDGASPIEVEYGATIAYLRGRQSYAASEYFDSVAAALDVCAGPGKRAMLRVEQAISDAKFGRIRLDTSCALVGEALAIDPDYSTSLDLRLNQWCRLAGRNPGVSEVRDTVSRVRQWQRAGT